MIETIKDGVLTGFEDPIDRAIGNILEIDDIQEAIDSAQWVFSFNDEVLLEEESFTEFDIQSFFASRGLGTERVKKIAQLMPPLITAEDMKKEFALPSLRQSSIDGTVKLALSEAVLVPIFTELLYYLRKDLDSKQFR